MKTKLWSSLVTSRHCCSTEYQLYSYCRGELPPAHFFRHTEADVHPSPLKCTELVPWDAGGRTEGCFWDGKRLYFSTCIAAPLRLGHLRWREFAMKKVKAKQMVCPLLLSLKPCTQAGSNKRGSCTECCTWFRDSPERDCSRDFPPPTSLVLRGFCIVGACCKITKDIFV